MRFKTIERQRYNTKYDDKTPGLIIVTSEAEAKPLQDWLQPDAYKQLRELNYDTNFAIVAFSGWYHSDHEGIVIEQITRHESTVTITASIGNPKGDAVVSSPYHLVQVQKRGQWDTDINFHLVVDEMTVATTTHFVP